MEQTAVSQLASQIYDLMGERLRVRGASLRARVKRAGRLLPKSVRRAAGELIAAEDMAENPVLATRLDPDAVRRAYETCKRYLTDVDPKEARSRARYNMAALISAQFLIVVALAVTLLRWRGFI